MKELLIEYKCKIFIRNHCRGLIMNAQDLKNRENDQIVKRLIELSSVTLNLKSIAYLMANISVETVKPKSGLKNSSVITTIDSIYYDLKRIQTILLKHSHMSKPTPISSSNHHHFNSYNSVRPHNFRTSQFKTFNLETPNYHQPTVSDINSKNVQKQSSKPLLNCIDDNFQPNQVSQYSSGDENKKFISKTLPINEYKKRKQSHEVGISQVSSYEYVGLSQNPTIKGQFHKISDQELEPSDDQKSCVKANHFCQQEYQKQLENQRFLREISKSREKILKNIERKKAKCLNTIKKMNSNIIQVSPDHQSKLKKSKLKSKTEKFYSQASKPYLNNLNDLQPSESFVGI